MTLQKHHCHNLGVNRAAIAALLFIKNLTHQSSEDGAQAENYPVEYAIAKILKKDMM